MSNSLVVRDLVVQSKSGREIVHGISLTVAKGERVALIGESGSGKTLTAAAIMGLLPDNLTAFGEINIGTNMNIIGESDAGMSRLRGSTISMVFQEPMTALDPLMRVGNQVAEAFAIHENARKKPPIRSLSEAALIAVGLPPLAYRAYPHQLSGGQRQRVLIAMALANEPDFLIADEPTTALDATVQAQVLELLGALVAANGTGLLFISHDLAVVARIAQRVYVLQGGRIVESGSVSEVFDNPQHRYTQTLIHAAKIDEGNAQNKLSREEQVMALECVSKAFTRRSGLLGRRVEVQAVNGVTFAVNRGERFGIVGESGSGKTTVLRIIAGIEQPTSGSVSVLGNDFGTIERLSRNTRESRSGTVRQARSQVQMIFQDPKGSLDPRMKIFSTIAEPLLDPMVQQRISQAATKRGRAQLVADMLIAVRLDPEIANQYPHELSGGQRQRISIARALISEPELLLADEPVSALDVTVRAQIIQLLRAQLAQRDLTLIIVSHDLSVIEQLCDRLAVMRQGEIIEQGDTRQIWANPVHPYTRQLRGANEHLPSFSEPSNASGVRRL